jgi:NADH-quinone oxidoreductase subunit L
LLFLGAGAVILALHHEQNIWDMGGLKDRMPVTFWTFLIGTLALCGVPPFSGFYSKDEVLAAAYHHSVALFIVGFVVSILTTFYMFRLLYVAFLRRPGLLDTHEVEPTPAVMKAPLILLAIAALFGGFWGIDRLFAAQFVGAESGGGHAAPAAVSGFSQLFAPFAHPLPALAGLAAVLFGFFAARELYAGAPSRDPLDEKLGLFARALRNRFYLDEIYAGLIYVTQEFAASVAGAIDRWILSGLVVRGISGTTDLAGRALRLFQTGNLQTYAFLFVAGVALVFFLVVGL